MNATKRRGRPAAHPLLDDPAWLSTAVAVGATLTDLAAELGCSVAAVSRAAARHGITPGPPPRRFPELGDREWLQAAADRGLNHSEIAAEVGCGRRAVWQAMASHGLPAGRPGRPPAHPLLADRAWLETRLAQGVPQKEIAAGLGCTPQAVSRAVARHQLSAAKEPK